MQPAYLVYQKARFPKEDYEKLQRAMKEMGMPFLSVDDFIDQQIEGLLEKYAEWTDQKEEHKKRSRKR